MFKLSFVLMILMELLTITVKTFFCFDDIDGIVDHHCKNFLLSTIPSISSKQKKV
jgi:hypothetical protein